MGDLVALEYDAARARREIARQEIDQRRFAGAIRTEQRVQLAAYKIEAHRVVCHQATEAARQRTRAQNRLRHWIPTLAASLANSAASVEIAQTAREEQHE